MKAGKYDITIEQDTGFSLPVNFKPDGQAADWTGLQGSSQGTSIEQVEHDDLRASVV